VLLSDSVATGVKASVEASGDGSASVAVQAELDGVSRSLVAEKSGLVVFMALRALEPKVGVATGPVLSEARVTDTLIATIQACFMLSCTMSVPGQHEHAPDESVWYAVRSSDGWSADCVDYKICFPDVILGCIHLSCLWLQPKRTVQQNGVLVRVDSQLVCIQSALCT
jgi:hypothetical protein